jgi:hypothetical protein
VEIIFAVLEEGYHTPDFRQDTQFLLSASLVCRSWRRPAQLLLFQHVVIHSQLAVTTLCNATTLHATHGNEPARYVRSLSAALDPGQPGCLQPLSLCHAVSLFPNLNELDLTCYPLSKSTTTSYQRDSQSPIFDHEALSTLYSGPPITTLRLANWSSDTSLLDKLLAVYQPSLRALSLRGARSSFSTPITSLLTTSHHALDLTLQPPLSPALLDWLTDHTIRPRVRTLEFTRQPELATLAALLAAHSDELRALALPTLTTAEAALVSAHCCHRLLSLCTEHPYSALPALLMHLRHVALAIGPALTLMRSRLGAGASGASGKLERVSVMLWRGNGEEQQNVLALKQLCAQLGVRIEFEREVKAFRARFRVDTVERA